jgi:hypothetical protein
MNMHNLSLKPEQIVLKVDTEGLSPVQVRLIKTIHSLMANVLATDEEDEYFQTSAALMQKTAEMIKHASFAVENGNIDYGTQAVEFAVDSLNESIDEDKIQNLDN